MAGTASKQVICRKQGYRPVERIGHSPPTCREVADIVKTLGHVAEYWMADPQRAMEVQTQLGRAYLDLWASAVRRMAGETSTPVIEPDGRDKRFNDPEWSSNAFFDFIKQAYLL